jgi:hypothetical protein
MGDAGEVRLLGTLCATWVYESDVLLIPSQQYLGRLPRHTFKAYILLRFNLHPTSLWAVLHVERISIPVLTNTRPKGATNRGVLCLSLSDAQINLRPDGTLPRMNMLSPLFLAAMFFILPVMLRNKQPLRL